MKKPDWKKYLLAIGLPALYLAAILLVFGFTYTMNDDTAMVTVLNGSYSGTPDPHCMFIRYPLAIVISTLYSLIPALDWYPIVMLGIYLFAMAFPLCQLMDRFPKHKLGVSLVFLGVLSLIWTNQTVQFTFTTCGAFVSASAAFSYALIRKEDDLKPGKLLPLLLLFWLSYCVRDYFALASLLLMSIVWLSKYWNEFYKNIKCWIIPVLGIAGMVACVAIHNWGYSAPEWANFRTYNDERASIQDFAGLPEYDENKEMYQSLGLEKRELKCINGYTYLLLDEFDANSFHVIAQVVAENESHPSISKAIPKTIKATVNHFLFLDEESAAPLQVCSIALVFLLVLASILVSIKDRKHYWVFPLLVMAGLGCMWLYISYEGRYPARVAQSLRIITISASLVGFALLFSRSPMGAKQGSREDKSVKSGKSMLSLVLVVLGVLMIGAGMVRSQNTTGQLPKYQRAAIYTYADEHPENIYLRDSKLSLSKLQTEPAVNTLPTGSWLHYSPLFYQKLARFDMTEFHQADLLRENVYLMVNEDRNLNAILGLSDDTPIDYEVVDTIGKVQVVQFHAIG